jgi:DNA mismatch endonuclease (patch repair protein)
MDRLSKEQRSLLMSKIRSKDTKPEMVVRKWLHANGYRFRLYRRDLPGVPDIVLPKYKLVIFVHGCFWHRHEGCKIANTPKSRIEYWINKLANNVRRDVLNFNELKNKGWNVCVVWECEVKAGFFANIIMSFITGRGKNDGVNR